MKTFGIRFVVQPKVKDGSLVSSNELDVKQNCIINYVEDQLLSRKLIIKTYELEFNGQPKQFSYVKTIGGPEWTGYLTSKYDSDIFYPDNITNRPQLENYYKSIGEFNKTLAEISKGALKECEARCHP